MDICRVTAKKVNGKAVFTGRQLKKALAGAKGFVVIGGVIVPVVRLRQYAGVMTKDTLALTVDYSKWVPGIIQIEVPGHRTRFKGVASDDVERMGKWYSLPIKDRKVTAQVIFEEVRT